MRPDIDKCNDIEILRQECRRLRSVIDEFVRDQKNATDLHEALIAENEQAPVDIVTEEELNLAFGNANFGSQTKREVVLETLTKFAQGYSSGHTAFQICLELGLLKTKGFNAPAFLTEKGTSYLFNHDATLKAENEKLREAVRDLNEDLTSAMFSLCEGRTSEEGPEKSARRESTPKQSQSAGVRNEH